MVDAILRPSRNAIYVLAVARCSGATYEGVDTSAAHFTAFPAHMSADVESGRAMQTISNSAGERQRRKRKRRESSVS